MIFEAIHKQFPNKASVRELPSLYDDLKRRYEPEDSSVEDKLMAGYIDGTAYRFGSAEDQEMINSHRNSNRNMSKNRKRGYSLNASNLICGANCFRLNMDEQSRKQLSTSNNKELNIKTEMGTVDDTSAACNDQWTISQQSMFVVLKRIYKNDFCKITNSLNCIDPDAPRKTCAQVNSFILFYSIICLFEYLFITDALDLGVINGEFFLVLSVSNSFLKKMFIFR
ncbi:unnamed protein product [Anisakis simplex]|uniref:MADF domain-containing protein n=1 Tax=Anisakis simplex TaxID=6269 RepID=A0A0M3JAA9_ANISI|nr:unnamed protein product [Anisakis simplex]